MSTENNLKSMSDLLIRACQENVLDPVGVLQEVLAQLPDEVVSAIVDDYYAEILETAYHASEDKA